MFKFLVWCGLVAVTCGASIPEKVHPIEEHVVGGTDTDISRVPYIVSVLYRGSHFCGGSIISDKLILSAAHCLKYKVHYDISFRVGSSNTKAGGTVVHAKEIYIHPRYREATIDYDVAVVELETPLNFSNTVQPIELVDYEPAAETMAQTSGWGRLVEGGVASETLQCVEVPVVSREECAKSLESFTKLTDRMFCAGVKGKDSCQGDSGGPLAVADRLAGIVSFGVGCARDKQPGVYTNIGHSSIKNFINIFLD